jgi:prepilin-type N-terminal cleavage/methylation domain-containing protein
MKKQDEGFTLIELLIVIIILGILATVVVFAVAGIRDSGDKSACEAELRSVETAIEAYYAENGVYTTTRRRSTTSTSVATGRTGLTGSPLVGTATPPPRRRPPLARPRRTQSAPRLRTAADLAG